MISLTIDPTLDYPEGSAGYSPDEAFPEYAFLELSSIKNPVYRAVRELFIQAELDREHLGTPDWNPLGKWITPGSKVFVLCNFANERRATETVMDYRSRCTHGSVIRAVTDYILIAAGNTGSVSFGNSPTQVCQWGQVLKDTGADEVQQFYQAHGKPVKACDLRLFVLDTTSLGAVRGVERRDESGGVHINLGPDSLLAELDNRTEQRFRVMNYSPLRTQAFHSAGKHEYVVNRQILDADVIVSIPKLKTHEKVGISCALKGFVGTVGHKDSLPHHRYGSPVKGGDEYPDPANIFQRFSTVFHETIQKTSPDHAWGSLLRAANRILKRSIRSYTPVIEGAWWGNDTAWRMVLDLVRIATYCSKDGVMQEKPCRKQLALIDGIYGGEGEGPAYCTAVHCGVLLFGDNLPAIDSLNAALMGFDPSKIPLIQRAFTLKKYPLETQLLGEETKQENLAAGKPEHACAQFKPSDGWKERLASQ